MRVTALGVHSAFAVGGYEDMLAAADVRALVSRAVSEARHGEAGADLAALESRIDTLRRRVYLPRWQSNFLLEFDSPGKVRGDVFRLVIDCGGDIRHSLAGVGLGFADIDAWYISHPHSDHIGGIEGVALSTLFHPRFTTPKAQLLGNLPVTTYLCEFGALPPECKPDLMGHASVLDELWQAAQSGLRTLQGLEQVELDTFFNTVTLKSNKNYSLRDGAGAWRYYTIVTTHVVAGRDLMPSYGLMFENGSRRIYLPTDTQLLMPPQVRYFYDHATTVYMDCETGFASGVHPHLDDLRKLDPVLKSKMWLYHYTEDPQFDAGEFAGVLRAGECHEYPAVAG